MRYEPPSYARLKYVRSLRPRSRCYVDPNVLLCFTEVEMARAARLYAGSADKMPRPVDDYFINPYVLGLFTPAQRHRAAHRLEICKKVKMYFELRSHPLHYPPYGSSRDALARFVRDTYRYSAQSGRSTPSGGRELCHLLDRIDRQGLLAKIDTL